MAGDGNAGSTGKQYGGFNVKRVGSRNPRPLVQWPAADDPEPITVDGEEAADLDRQISSAVAAGEGGYVKEPAPDPFDRDEPDEDDDEDDDPVEPEIAPARVMVVDEGDDPKPKKAKPNPPADPENGPRKRGRPAKSRQLRRLSKMDRQIMLLGMIRDGKTFREIARELHYAGPAGAYQAYQVAVKELVVQPTSEEMLPIIRERYEGLWSVSWKKGQFGDVGAMNVALRVLKNLTDLHGLQAPAKIELDIEPRLRALAAQLGLDPDQTVEITRSVLEAQRQLADQAQGSSTTRISEAVDALWQQKEPLP